MHFILVTLIVVALVLAGVIGGLVLYIWQNKGTLRSMKSYSVRLEDIISWKDEMLSDKDEKISDLTDQRDAANKMLEVVVPMVPEKSKPALVKAKQEKTA